MKILQVVQDVAAICPRARLYIQFLNTPTRLKRDCGVRVASARGDRRAGMGKDVQKDCLTCCNNSSSDGLLARKKQQTAREVKRARRTWHRTENPRLECTVGEHTTVHSTVLSPVLIDLQPWASTPFAVSLCSPAGHASNIGGRAQRRCKCARCTPLVPNLSLPPRKP